MKITTGKMFAVAALLGAIGCGQPAPGATTNESIKVSELPDVRGCDSLGRVDARLNAKLLSVDGVDDLYLVELGGRAACADSWDGVVAAMQRSGIHTHALASSNPMPGVDPTSDGSSNPMPGSDPAASNPMPGSDPNKSGKH